MDGCTCTSRTSCGGDVDNNGERPSGSNGPKMTRFILTHATPNAHYINLENVSMDAIYLIHDVRDVREDGDEGRYVFSSCIVLYILLATERLRPKFGSGDIPIRSMQQELIMMH